MKITPKDPTPRNKFRKWMKDVYAPAILRTLRKMSALRGRVYKKTAEMPVIVTKKPTLWQKLKNLFSKT